MHQNLIGSQLLPPTVKRDVKLLKLVLDLGELVGPKIFISQPFLESAQGDQVRLNFFKQCVKLVAIGKYGIMEVGIEAPLLFKGPFSCLRIDRDQDGRIFKVEEKVGPSQIE